MTNAVEKLLGNDWMVLPIEARRQLFKAQKRDLAWVEVPVSLEEFLYGPAYLNHIDFYLSDIQLETVATISEVFDIQAANEDPSRVIFAPHQYIEAVCQWGKGGGKDATVRMAFSRLMYLFGCLADPQGTFGMARYDSITLLNVAVSADQADDVFFDPFKRMIECSPWFMQKLRPIIRDRSIDCPPIIGRDPKRGDMYAISALSGHSGKAALEGKNLFLCVMDEIDEFRAKKKSGGEKSSADEFYDSVTSSVQSRFPGVGKVVLLSWPRHAESFIVKKREEGEKDPDVYTSGPYATFETNLARTKEEFAKEKKRNLERYQAMYLAQPGRLMEGYFREDVPALLRAFHARKEAGEIIRDVNNPGIESPVDWRTMDLLLDNMEKPDRNMLYCWHVDLAVTQCNAAAAMAHHGGWFEDEYGDKLPAIVLDLAYYWTAPEGRQIDFAAIRRFILDFARMGYRCVSVTFDGFESVDSRQRLAEYDQFGQRVRHDWEGRSVEKPIETDKFSLDRNTVGYDTFKAIVNEPGRFRAFYCPLAVREFLGLVREGVNKIGKVEGGSKDVSDAIAGAVYNATMHVREDVGFVDYWQGGMGKMVVGAETPMDIGHVSALFGAKDRSRFFG